jgi:urease accessory protein
LLSVAALGVENPALDTFIAAVRAGASPGNLAVGYGVVAPALGLGVEEMLHAYLYASVASLVAAGQKLIPLAGSAAQRVLYEVGGDVIHTSEIGKDMEVDDVQAFSPTVDVRSMMHERQRTRLYIS